jgi:hypothetical protein
VGSPYNVPAAGAGGSSYNIPNGNAAIGGRTGPSNNRALANPQPASKGGSLVGNLINNTEGFLRGIGPGIVHAGAALVHDTGDLIHHGPTINTDLSLNPLDHPKGTKPSHFQSQVLAPLIHSEGQYYGPLAKGDFGGFYRNFHANPLNAIIDAAAVATGGAGALSHVGALSREAKALTVPDLAKQMGQEGNDVTLRMSHQNPVIRGRQVAVNKLLNSPAVPDATPIIGSEARLARQVVRSSSGAGETLALKAVPLEQAFSKLSKVEKAAWHLKMQHLDPHGYQDLLASKVIGNPKSTEAVMWKKLEGAKLNDLYKNPMASKKLMAALAEGHKAADLLTADKTVRGILDPVTAVERPYLPQRLINDAKIVPPDKATEFRPAGIHDQPGASIPELAQKLDVQGEAAGLPDALRQPSYVPHSAKVDRPLVGQFRGRVGANPAARPGSTRMNEGTLLGKGMLNLHKNSLADEMRLHGRFVQRSDVHSALMQVAAKLPEGGLPNRYRYLKAKAGEASVPYTEQAAGALKNELESKQSLLDRFTTRKDNLGEEEYARDAEGHKLIIPDHVANSLAMNARVTPSLVHDLLWNKPLTVWKHMILGLRPAYMVNIIASQHILGALQMAGGGRGVEAYLNHLIPGARLGKLTDATVEDTMPEQSMATFSGSTGTAGVGRLASKAYQGVMPATMKAENWLRRLMIEGWAKSEPAVQKAMAENGGDINKALRQVATTDPHILHEISSRVDHAQGNYRTYSAAEQKLRQIVPFYGWDRHIIQSTYRILAERPGTANVGLKLGQQGQQSNLAQYGKLPAYLQGLVGIPKSWLPGWLLKAEGAGTTPVLESKAFEPFSTDADILKFAQSAFSGKPGAANDQLSSVNPYITGALEYATGKNLLTGTALKGHIPGGFFGNVPARIALGLPQARLFEQAIGWHPLGVSKAPTSSQDTASQALTLLGAPIKGLNKARANSLAAKIP